MESLQTAEAKYSERAQFSCQPSWKDKRMTNAMNGRTHGHSCGMEFMTTGRFPDQIEGMKHLALYVNHEWLACFYILFLPCALQETWTQERTSCLLSTKRKRRQQDSGQRKTYKLLLDIWSTHCDFATSECR